MHTRTLRETRQTLRLTQKKAADHLGIPFRTYQRMEASRGQFLNEATTLNDGTHSKPAECINEYPPTSVTTDDLPLLDERRRLVSLHRLLVNRIFIIDKAITDASEGETA